MTPVSVLGWMVVGWFTLLTAALGATVIHSVVQTWRTRPASRLARQNVELLAQNRDLVDVADRYRVLLERELRKSSL